MNAEALFERAFQVALSSATNLVARNQMQPVGIYALFVGEQRFSGCTLCKKNLSFGGYVAVVVFLENWAVKSYYCNRHLITNLCALSFRLKH
jgi:hypothetical protein